jgi:hypothetical protein
VTADQDETVRSLKPTTIWRERLMSTIQNIVNGNAVDIEYSINPEAVPDAVGAIVELYDYLNRQIPYVRAVLRSCVGKADAGMEIPHCNVCEAELGDLLAVVDHFITTERDTIRHAYSEALSDEEVEELENEDLCEAEDLPLAEREVDIESEDFMTGIRGALGALDGPSEERVEWWEELSLQERAMQAVSYALLNTDVPSWADDALTEVGAPDFKLTSVRDADGNPVPPLPEVLVRLRNMRDILTDVVAKVESTHPERDEQEIALRLWGSAELMRTLFFHLKFKVVEITFTKQTGASPQEEE